MVGLDPSGFGTGPFLTAPEAHLNAAVEGCGNRDYMTFKHVCMCACAHVPGGVCFER